MELPMGLGIQRAAPTEVKSRVLPGLEIRSESPHTLPKALLGWGAVVTAEGYVCGR